MTSLSPGTIRGIRASQPLAVHAGARRSDGTRYQCTPSDVADRTYVEPDAVRARITEFMAGPTRKSTMFGGRPTPRQDLAAQPGRGSLMWYGTSATMVLGRVKSRSLRRSAVWLWSRFSHQCCGTNSERTTSTGRVGSCRWSTSR